MKDANGFDGLARQKLAERGFGFDEAHWTDMERLLRERKRKPKAWWPWMAAGMLLVGGGVLWAGLDDQSGTLSAPSSTVAEQRTVISTTVQAPAEVQQTTAPVIDPVASATAQETAGSEQVFVGKTSRATPAQRTAMEADNALTKEAHPENAKISPPIASQAKGSDAPTTPAESTPVVVAAVITDMDQPGLTGAPSEIPAGTGTPDVAVIGEEQNTGTPDAGTAEPVTLEPNTLPSADATVTSPPVVGAAMDPPGPEPAQTPSPAAWLAVQAPFEITALGGVFSTTSIYSGEATENWGATTERQNSIDLGVEAARSISDHFSVGFGAHYARYKERLLADETTRTDQWISTGYELVPHDTLVMMVTGVVTIGSVDYYTTELVPMTINVVEQTVDTTWTTTVVREQLNVINTVGYLEIPLFLDAHLSAGRWAFGVRAGPTFGILTGRQGTLPSSDETGYAAMEEHDFSALTLGCSARAYARYRLSRSFAVGLEPAWRRQLGNAFGDDELQRRGEALGAYLSLSYRFGGETTP